jgi:2-dehydro-3-deoxyphosphogalactonate aldolase
MSDAPATQPTASAWPTALPLVAILRGIAPREALAHAQALVAAGFDCIEVPTNSPDWPASVRAIATAFARSDTAASDDRRRVLVGAGTVTETAHIDALQAAGGSLVVSPHLDTALVAEAVRRGLVVLPGAMTPSEVFAALRAGATAVKLFPAATLGIGHVRALRAVLPRHAVLLAVGGVSPANLGEWLAAGCQGAGLGGELYKPGQPVHETAARAAAFVAAYRAVRAAMGSPA